MGEFQSGLINSKKIPKNVKFGLQTYINMENKMNGSDRPFEVYLIGFRDGGMMEAPKMEAFEPSSYIYIYI